MTTSLQRASEGTRRRSSDPVTWYLATIGREPLLTPAEEIELGNQVQTMMRLLEEAGEIDREITDHENKLIRIGKRAKQRMMKANLRLVVSVAKKYQGKGLELLDLIQEGSLGLEYCRTLPARRRRGGRGENGGGLPGRRHGIRRFQEAALRSAVGIFPPAAPAPH